MYLIPPHTAADLARATMQRDLAFAGDISQDDSRNALVVVISAMVRWIRSLLRPATMTTDAPRTATVDPCAPAVSAAGVVPFPTINRRDDDLEHVA